MGLFTQTWKKCHKDIIRLSGWAVGLLLLCILSELNNNSKTQKAFQSICTLLP